MPERAGQAEAGYWHHLRWVVRTLATAPLPPAERPRCFGELARRASEKAGEWAPIVAGEAAESLARRAYAYATTRGRAGHPAEPSRQQHQHEHQHERDGAPVP